MEKNIYAISYKMRRELYHKIFSVAGIVLLFFVLVSLFMTFIIFPVANKSDSMSPDIPAGSYEFVSPLLKNPERGDVILLQNYKDGKMSPVKRILRTISLFVTVHKWQPFEENPVSGTRPVLRRVVGLPGDTIYIDRYVVFIKPAGQNHFLTEFELTNSRYNAKILVPPALWDSDLGARASISQIKLADDEYFVLGDDRLSSADSRIWGPVKHSSILGKALVLYFPFNKFSFL
ncbi:signal peptidase I [Treponema ruminis]|uniref:Signal peptidase I n=1 Tax=Treponema ruminis TaxID=744515 RepID=A0A7W8G8H4_9SPIR|nr:signal peptidase I [Treponema ruminis]MBB5225761.1 signal peptidase I [Treponema ruminis]QSI02451.1 signal peptidase I [Treponema ruminis]